MVSLSADRPTEVVLAARVARQFYLEGFSKVEIADRLGISRFRVARLLDSARESGLVRIEIGLPGGVLDAGLSAELCSAFGLTAAEAKLAAKLASGSGIEGAAASLGVSRETARTQLKAVFGKTNTRRQAELVALVSRLRS